jgi:uncharacterized membrane protein YkvA (DUF1232 family)
MSPTNGAQNQMTDAATRTTFRWIHIVCSIPIIGYVYSPFDAIPDYAQLRGLSFFLSCS